MSESEGHENFVGSDLGIEEKGVKSTKERQSPETSGELRSREMANPFEEEGGEPAVESEFPPEDSEGMTLLSEESDLDTPSSLAKENMNTNALDLTNANAVDLTADADRAIENVIDADASSSDPANTNDNADENHNQYNSRSAGTRPGGQPGGSRSASARTSPTKTNATDEQIRNLDRKTGMITGKMKNNLDELMKRDVALDDLEETAGGLAADAKKFHLTSKKVNRKMWCRNHKWSFLIAAAVIVVVVGLSLAIAGSMGAFK